jgi:hypothetical protein
MVCVQDYVQDLAILDALVALQIVLVYVIVVLVRVLDSAVEHVHLLVLVDVVEIVLECVMEIATEAVMVTAQMGVKIGVLDVVKIVT